MIDWVTQTDRSLAFNERGVLDGAGSVSREAMSAAASAAYGTFDAARRKAEAERALRDEADDLQELTALEQRSRPGSEGSDGHEP